MKKAFTLSEVLVCVAIIGTLSSLMLIHLNGMRVQQNVFLYKKTFSDLQNLIGKMAGDTSIFPVYEDALKRSPNNIGDANQEADAVYFCKQLTKRLVTDNESAIDCKSISNSPSDTSYSPNITLTTGVQIAGLGKIFDDGDAANYIEDFITLCVDTNGDKAPNKGCDADNSVVNKRDRFRIKVYYTGKLATDENWTFENQILMTQSGAAKLKSEDYPDANIGD